MCWSLSSDTPEISQSDVTFAYARIEGCRFYAPPRWFATLTQRIKSTALEKWFLASSIAKARIKNKILCLQPILSIQVVDAPQPQVTWTDWLVAIHPSLTVCVKVSLVLSDSYLRSAKGLAYCNGCAFLLLPQIYIVGRTATMTNLYHSICEGDLTF
jgi:hypothetical protein